MRNSGLYSEGHASTPSAPSHPPSHVPPPFLAWIAGSRGKVPPPSLSGNDDEQDDDDKDDVADSVMELEWPGEEKKKRRDLYTAAKSGVVVSVSSECGEGGGMVELELVVA
ncbi:hypothetical protein ACET3Z_019261 [Daucus carota]